MPDPPVDLAELIAVARDRVAPDPTDVVLVIRALRYFSERSAAKRLALFNVVDTDPEDLAGLNLAIDDAPPGV